MLCSRCHKRQAVVFVSNGTDTAETKGYCLICAKELGIKPVDDLMEKMGITPEVLESFENEFGSALADAEENGFEPGGAQTFPFLQNIFGQNPARDSKKGDAEKTAKSQKKEPEKKRRFIGAYCTDLTARARAGELDAIIGRDKEISRVVQILCRRTKNNPCLIGDPGVGKTAIAEGLAQRIASGDVPAKLQRKEIQLLDLTALVAGTQFRGQFESRIKGLVDEVKQSGNIILFVDEVHNLVGTGDAEGSMNAANILKPALSRGEIQVVGATTFNEYRKYIEKDAALERRFQPVTVAEPSVADTIEILRGIKKYYENYHKVKVSDEMVRRAAVLSERYITDRYLPDKAIDLLDEACTHAALRNPILIDFENASLQLEDLKKEEAALTAEGIEPDYEKIAKVRYEISCAENTLSELGEQASKAQVEEQDVAHVIELWTGIPANRVQENELKKLQGFEDKLRARVIGQDQAVSALAAAIRRSRVQISPRRRPASFIFVGPTGVGKTELVKVMSEELFDSPETLIRLDMSEFMEKHSVSRIIGSPPGYVGYDEAGQVTEKVRRRPYSVLLFDEIEKAHPDVMNILLQILDEGRVTDAHGRTVNFENTVLVMTSNAGSEIQGEALGFAKTVADQSREKALKSLSSFLRPEFLSRVDEVIVFNPLTQDDYEKIAALMMDEYKGTLEEKGIRFSYDRKACKNLAKNAYGGKSGARDLRNLIRREIEDKITDLLIDRDGALEAIAATEKDGSVVLEAI